MTPDAPAPHAEPVEPHRYQLWFEQFRDMAVMALSLAGGGITLLGTIFAGTPRPVSAFFAVFLFFVGALIALVAQTKVVGLADEGKPPDASLRRLRTIAFGCIGGGVGAFFSFAMRAMLR